MRQVSLGNYPQSGSVDDKLNFIWKALQDIERASAEDTMKVFNTYDMNATPTVTRTLNVSAPSTSNLAAVLGTLIADIKRGGVKRSG